MGRRGRMRQKKAWWLPLVAVAVLMIFFAYLFYADNKYQTPPPYGRSGILNLSERDLRRGSPLYLIDGWLLTDQRTEDQPTYIGEFSNLQRGDLAVSPHGWARYELTLCYDGAPSIVSVMFPQLSFQYTISVDGTQLTRGMGNGKAVFLLTAGSHVLTVETVSEMGYYSGMYFPPALGLDETLSRVSRVQSFAYALAFFLPITLAVFTVFLWRAERGISRCFGMLCCCYALYMFRYFVFWFAMPGAQYWFLVQSMALYCLCFCVVRLTALAAGAVSGRAWRWIRAVLLALPAALLLLSLSIPAVPWAVYVHGKLTDFYYMYTFFGAAFFAVRGIKARNWESRYTLTGCVVFGMGLSANLLFSNLFEPVSFFWQFEWCGLLLVLLFGAMMVSRSHRLLRENDALTNHLEEQVKKRTEEVRQLLEERKAFFSDMAHDLKAPVFATQSFIRAIRGSGVGVDAELRGYLDQAEAKQWEMARRLQGLSAINALDKIEEEPVRISVCKMLSEIHAVYGGEAEVQLVYLSADQPEHDAFILAQQGKIDILFENLIYNALKATPPGGRITVSARTGEGRVRITVADTGHGIPEEELPFIFRRFYVGAGSRDTGTGLGLYIVHSIVAELGGTISVWSVVGKGTKFTLEFPEEHL